MKIHNLEEIEFFYTKFAYNRNVLTPRFDTESLVREAILLIKKHEISTLIDIWVWSGIIPISIWKNVKLDKIIAIDKSKKALKIAKLNAQKNKVLIDFMEWDLLKPFLDKKNHNNIVISSLSRNLLITANLPYVKNEDWINMSSDTKFEPKMALFWGEKTGFEVYERFFRQVLKFRQIYDNKIFIMCEIWFDQKEVAQKFLTKLGFNFSFFPDLMWIERFIKISL
ncbi:MAG: Protoporphyrinogen oxidase [uncultured bacterium (gcode 4)]|uniref:Protoporphyrinogen oxidase n=1 Tax=uncultured bacterium (gcode 4) TaxID=1234023 RepID=K2BVP3_9BACT|nr:MAG: Protoporphyrinogen oxidase [uncultured bacterium (gcode 4)]